MPLNGALRHKEFVSDILIGVTIGDHLLHFQFAFGQGLHQRLLWCFSRLAGQLVTRLNK